MRVLHLSAGNLYGGVERILTTLARDRNLCPTMEPQFAVCYEGRLSRELRASEVPVHVLEPVRTSRPWTVLRCRREVAKIIADQAIDMAVCHMAWAQAIFTPGIRLAGIPVVCYLHGRTSGTHWVERWAKRNPPDATICVSESTSYESRSMFPEIPRQVIYSPLPGECLRQEYSSARKQVRRELDTRLDSTVILQVSRMEALKGQTVLLDALARIASRTDWTCWVVGAAQRPAEQTYFAQLKQMAEQAGISQRIRFTGERADVPRLMASADIFCQPNLGPEGFSIVFMEAFLASLPVVTSRLGGAVEMVDENCGFLLPVGDAANVSRALTNLLDSEEQRCRLGQQGRRKVISMCDTGTQLSKLESFFQSVQMRTAVQRVATEPNEGRKLAC